VRTCSRAARGKIRTIHDQIRGPSARKKYVENRTSKAPVSTCPTVVVTLASPYSRRSFEDVIVACADARASLIWLSLTASAPERSHARISPSPAATWSARSRLPLATCLPVKLKSRTMPVAALTSTSSAATERGILGRTNPRTAGIKSAARSSETASDTASRANRDTSRTPT